MKSQLRADCPDFIPSRQLFFILTQTHFLETFYIHFSTNLSFPGSYTGLILLGTRSSAFRTNVRVVKHSSLTHCTHMLLAAGDTCTNLSGQGFWALTSVRVEQKQKQKQKCYLPMDGGKIINPVRVPQVQKRENRSISSSPPRLLLVSIDFSVK